MARQLDPCKYEFIEDIQLRVATTTMTALVGAPCAFKTLRAQTQEWLIVSRHAQDTRLSEQQIKQETPIRTTQAVGSVQQLLHIVRTHASAWLYETEVSWIAARLQRGG